MTEDGEPFPPGRHPPRAEIGSGQPVRDMVIAKPVEPAELTATVAGLAGGVGAGVGAAPRGDRPPPNDVKPKLELQ